MAKKNDINVSVGVDTKGYAKSWDDVTKITQGASKDLEKEAAKMALAVTKKIEGMNLNSQARQLQNLTAKMMDAGLEGTKAFSLTAAAAGKLRANIDDAKGVIEAFRPDAPFKALSTTLGAAAQGFAGVQGAMALFGAESEDVQKTLLKVQAAMAFAEGFKAIDGLTDGFTQLNLVIKANPLIAGVAIFTAAAAAMYALSKSSDEAAQANERLSVASTKAFEKTIDEKAGLEQLLRVYNDKNTTDEERLKIQKQLVEKYPEYLGQISTEGVEQNKVNSGVTSYIKLLELKAKAQAFQEMYVEALKKEQKILKDIGSDSDIFFSMGMATGGKTGKQVEAENLRKELQGIKSQWDAISSAASAAENAQKQAFGGGNNQPTYTPPKGGGKKTTVSKIGNAADFNGFSRGLTAITTAAPKAISSIDAVKYSIQQTSAEAMKFADSAKQMAQLVEANLESMAANVGVAIGQALAGEDVQIGDVLLLSIADFAEQMGKLMIATGIAIEAFKQSIATLGVFAIPAGIALIAAASAAKSHINAGPKGFAEGGVIGGNSFSGDRLLAPVNSGEVILNTGQQNQLLRMANGNGGNGNVGVIAKFTGRDLLIMYDNARKDGRR